MPTLGESLYESVCKETTSIDPSCLQLLRTDPRITNAKNYLELSIFILELGVTKGKEAKNYMKEIAKTHPTEGIKLCAGDYYEAVIQSFRGAIIELKENSTLSASYDAKVAGDVPESCVELLAEVKIDYPLINKEVALISYVAFLAIDHIPIKIIKA